MSDHDNTQLTSQAPPRKIKKISPNSETRNLCREICITIGNLKDHFDELVLLHDEGEKNHLNVFKKMLLKVKRHEKSLVNLREEIEKKIAEDAEKTNQTSSDSFTQNTTPTITRTNHMHPSNLSNAYGNSSGMSDQQLANTTGPHGVAQLGGDGPSMNQQQSHYTQPNKFV